MNTNYHPKSRRAFLQNVSRGMIISGIGGAAATDLGFSSAFANEGDEPDAGAIHFGELEPLVALMQNTQQDKLQPQLVEMLKTGKADLSRLTAAGALANARTFGGEDYDGYHVMMALAPALEMSQELPKEEAALPVLKVLYRNTARMQFHKANKKKPDVLRQVDGKMQLPEGADAAKLLRQATRSKNVAEAEQILAALTERSPQEAYDALQFAVQDRPNVHGVALAHRAWEMVDLIGQEHAHTLLRQSVHFCAKSGSDQGLMKVLAQQIEALEGKEFGTKTGDDAWVAELANTIFNESRAGAAEATGQALIEGFSPEAVGEAVSLAANEIVLRQTTARVHGDSRGVHASDAANAWRNIARVTNDRNQIASLVVAAYHVGGAGNKVIVGQSAGSPLSTDPDAFALFRNHADSTKAPQLLDEVEEAIRANDQILATSALLRYSELENAESRPVFDLLLRYAVSEDGRLHAEKYYRTVTEEFAATRPAYRWRQLIALARISASAYGMNRQDQPAGRAPGYEQARELLGLA